MHSFIQYSIIFSSLCFWFYIDSKKIYNIKKERKIVNSALIHALVSGIGYNMGIICNPTIVYDYYSITNNISDIYILIPLISFGYSFYDLYIGIKSRKFENIMHGVLFFSYFCFLYYKNLFGTLNIIMITETSSIFLNLRPLGYKIIDILFIVSFFVFRLILSPITIYLYLIHPDNVEKPVVFWGMVSLTSLNIYWFYYIVKKALRPMKKIEEIEEAKNE
jgi:hypothetical protein